MNAYVDSSLLVSVYLTDDHSALADERVASESSIWLTPLNRAELANAISQQVFRGRVNVIQAHKAWEQFKGDCHSGLWNEVSFPAQAWMRAIELSRLFTEELGVRTLDTLHVACALELRAQRFWTFDERQARLAEAAGLDTRF